MLGRQGGKKRSRDPAARTERGMRRRAPGASKLWRLHSGFVSEAPNLGFGASVNDRRHGWAARSAGVGGKKKIPVRLLLSNRQQRGPGPVGVEFPTWSFVVWLTAC